MKNLKLFILFIAIIPLLSSCWSTQYISLQDEYNNEWKGASKKEIILKWGIPNKEIDMDNDESVLVYEDNVIHTNVYEEAKRRDRETDATTKIDRQYKEFYLDNNKNCYAVRTNEVREIRQSEPVNTAILVGGIATGVTLIAIWNFLSTK